MCGICGVVSAYSDQVIDKTILRHMTQLLYHRGPDDEGYYISEHVALGMRRLSIIDLLTGHQPITNEDGTLRLVFNGEIYNYRRLRDQLEKRGHIFASKSDSETIIHAYEEYGPQCLEHLNGMFAFAVWDAPKRSLLLARDRLGIKPLYYWVGRKGLVFGSELKAVIAHPDVPRDIDPIGLDQFLTLEYIPAPRTIFKEVRKLPPGHLLTYKGGQLSIEEYWDVRFQEIPEDETDCVAILTELISDAVRLRLMSDVPLGAFLSGGIDSSTVLAFMDQASATPIQTFSIGFDDATYNELPYARLVASHFNTHHTEEILQPDIANLAECLVGHLGEPLADFSIFPTYLVSKLASSSVKVILSGDGGDELFCGYETYVAQQFDRFYRWLPAPIRRKALPALMNKIPPRPAKKGLTNKAKRFVEGAALPASLQHTRWMIFMSDDDRVALYNPGWRETLNGYTAGSSLERYFQRATQASPLAQQQYVDIKTYLADNILAKVDRMSMAASIEARVPLLDHRIVEFALNLPPNMKLYRGQTKVILRQAMNSRLPDVVLNKPKQGFSIPLKHWLGGPLKPLMTDLLSGDAVRHRGYFEPHTIAHWIAEHLDGRTNHSHRLWALMVFELWHRQVLDA